MAGTYPMICNVLPTVGEACARSAYERHVAVREAANLDHLPACLPWDALSEDARRDWEAVAMAAVTEYEAQLAAGKVNDQWHLQVASDPRGEAALRELCTKGRE